MKLGSHRTKPIRRRERKGRTLLPATTVTRAWPVNVVPGDESLFCHQLVKRPPVRIRTVRAAKVIIPGHGPCSWSGPIRETCYPSPYPPLDRRTKARVRAGGAKAWWITTAERSKSDELFWITDTVSHEYFHWLTDALTKL